MRRIAVVALVIGLLGTAWVAGARHVAAAETHTNCIVFGPDGNPVSFTPNCTQTMTSKASDSFSFPVVNPCTGDPGTVTFVLSHQIYHITVNGAGDIWDTGTFEGAATFTPAVAGRPSGAGHWTHWFGDSINSRNSVTHATFSVELHLSNGQMVVFHDTTHQSFTPNGPAVSFDKPTGGCR